MTAPARRPAALPPHHWRPASRRPEYWRQAAEIRREWLEIGLSTEPADRAAAEEAIASIYARHRRARPEFRWVASPRAALPYLAGLPTHETLRSWVDSRRPPGYPPIASDIAAGLSRLRSELAEGYVEPPPDRPLMKRPKDRAWPRLPPLDALDASLPFQEIVRQGVREALFRSLADGVYLPIRAALAAHQPLSAADGEPASLAGGALPSVAGGALPSVVGNAPSAAGGALPSVTGGAPPSSAGGEAADREPPSVAGGEAFSAANGPAPSAGHREPPSGADREPLSAVRREPPSRADRESFSAARHEPPPPGRAGSVKQPGTTILVRRPQAGGGLPVGWYGHQDAAWIGHLDVLGRLGLVRGGHGAAFDAWVTLARAGGWWWPGERVCVLAERPAVIRTEPVPGAWHGEVRLRRDHGKPAVEYRDGWTI